VLSLYLSLAITAEPTKHEWKVDDVQRQAIVYASPPKDGVKPPAVFVFHGHGGTMQQAARSFRMHEHWSEAVVVYPQGLPTPGALTDPDGKRAGWEHTPTQKGGRDLKFFDAMLATLKDKYQIDPKRVYATGHSNGGGFTYLIFSQRQDVFAAIAPSSCGGAQHLRDAKPVPTFHIAGESDPLVKMTLQQRTIDAVKKLNQCESDGKDWAKHCKRYESKSGAPLITYIHAGDHKFAQESVPLIVKFFKEHVRKD
jgi:polyhydroxybutyrate depolymerase